MINKAKFEEDLLEVLKKHKIETDNLIELKIELKAGCFLIIVPSYEIGDF